jgi:hypothetical protein
MGIACGRGSSSHALSLHPIPLGERSELVFRLQVEYLRVGSSSAVGWPDLSHRYDDATVCGGSIARGEVKQTMLTALSDRQA